MTNLSPESLPQSYLPETVDFEVPFNLPENEYLPGGPFIPRPGDGIDLDEPIYIEPFATGRPGELVGVENENGGYDIVQVNPEPEQLQPAPRSSRRLADMTRDLQDDDSAHSEVSALTQRSKDLLRGTQQDGELHRAYAPLVAGMLRSEVAGEFVRRLDAAATAESERLKAEARTDGVLETDVLVVGAGTHAAIYNARLRSERPNLRIVSVESAQQLGGQFRMYGNRPVFYTNSRGHRPERQGQIGLPRGGVNLNSFGEKAPIQVTDFATNTYATNVEFGMAAALNQHMSADTMLGVTMFDTTAQGDRYLVDVRDEESGEYYQISARAVVEATGPGNRGASPYTVTAEEIFSHFADETNMFPMDRFVDKTIAIIGAGDTGRVLAELFARMAPPEAYGKSTPQLGGPRQVLWFGTDFRDRDEYCDANRPRYDGLAPFIPRDNRGVLTPTTDLIVPFRDRVLGVFAGSDPDRRILALDFEDVGADIVITATNLASDTYGAYEEFMRNGGPDEVIEPIDLVGGGIIDDVSIGKELDGGGIQIVGPAARNRLTQYERRLTPEIGENTISIWANRFRTEEMARRMARRLIT